MQQSIVSAEIENENTNEEVISSELHPEKKSW